MLNPPSRDPDLDARSAQAYGCPRPDHDARRMLSLGEASSLRFAPMDGPTTDSDGALRRRYTKDVIHTGTYRHPDEGWTLFVTRERIDGWVRTLKRMLSAGIDVEVFADHGQQGSRSERIRGYVRDGWRDGDELIFEIEMVGQRGIELAETVHTASVEIDDDFISGLGEHFGEAITALAIGEKPIVPNQRPFERIAASLVA